MVSSSKNPVRSEGRAMKWTFRQRFRCHAFGWRSQPAIRRIKEAVSEIKRVARGDALLAAEGAVSFLERLSPTLEHVDSSSGAIGTAVNKGTTNCLSALLAAERHEELLDLLELERHATMWRRIPISRSGRAWPLCAGWPPGTATRSLAPTCSTRSRTRCHAGTCGVRRR